MKTLRQIVQVKKHSLHILLPNDFHGDKVEVIVLQLKSQNIQKKKTSSLRGKLKMTGKEYSDFQKHISSSRNEWKGF